MVLAQQQTYRSMEQDRKLRNKPSHLCQLIYDKGGNTYNGGKTVSSISGAGKTDSYMYKNKTRTFSNTIYKNRLKMD